MSGCMKHFTLEEIARACGGKYVGNEDMKNTPITSVERDSREIKEGSLFLAIKGERVDGHDYIEKCYKSGAVCAICERPVENAQKPYILVESTLEAVKKIAKAYRENLTFRLSACRAAWEKPAPRKCFTACSRRSFLHTKRRAT